MAVLAMLNASPPQAKIMTEADNIKLYKLGDGPWSLKWSKYSC